MKKTTALGIISLSLLAAAACSDDEGAERTTDPIASAGTTMSGGGTGGSGGGSMGGTGGTVASSNNYGTDFSITDGNIVAAGEAIGGNIFPVANGLNGGDEATGREIYIGSSPPDDTASHIAVFAATDNKICMSGTIKDVPGGETPTYDTHWGVQAGLNLNVPGTELPADTDTTTAADAGVGDPGLVDGGTTAAAATEDAGGGTDDTEATPEPWEAGTVLGFSYTIEGSAPPPVMRFLAVPSNPELSMVPGVDDKSELNFCSEFIPFSGSNVDVLFSDITDRCWSGGVPRLDFLQPLDSISWQIPAAVGPASNFEYDFCISNIRAIVP